MATSRVLCSLSRVGKTTCVCVAPHRYRNATSGVRKASGSHLPRVADPALWRAIVPRFLRKRQDDLEGIPTDEPIRKIQKKTNPGTSIIVLGLLVGSFAINIIALRNQDIDFNRKTEAKLSLLREVVQNVKNGERVDVKRLLGTGDPQQEQEWEELIRDLENKGMLGEDPNRNMENKESQEKGKTWVQTLFSSSEQPNSLTSHDEDRTKDSPVEKESRPRPKFIM